MLHISQLIKLSPLFLDTSLFIYLFEDHPVYASAIQPVFDALSSDKMSAYSSIITVSEVLTKPIENKGFELTKKYQEIFLHLPNLTIASPTYDIAVQAAIIRARYKFQLIDCFQLALASHYQCLAFLTNDKKLKKFKDLRIILL